MIKNTCHFQGVCFSWNANYVRTITVFILPSILIQEECQAKFVKSGMFTYLKEEEIFGHINLLLGNGELVLSHKLALS